MFTDFYKKIYEIIYEKFVLAFFLLVVLVALILFAAANIFLLEKEIDVEKTTEKSFQERFLNAYSFVEKNKKGADFSDSLIDFFNLRR
ncbi:MAG: hypothetical protein Q8O39_02465 [bacterium]|nr:hypothetical protein [bacterium]